MKECAKCKVEKRKDQFSKNVCRKNKLSAICKQCKFRYVPKKYEIGKFSYKLMRTWQGINYRCNNPKYVGHTRYGGKGIIVEWKNFSEFKDDMYDSFLRHIKLHGKDRADSSGNYSKENCRWATQKVQQNNRGNNRNLTINDKTKTLAQWTELFGISKSTVYRRVKLGWDIEKAIITPVQKQNIKKISQKP